jgi:hypothetical protein
VLQAKPQVPAEHVGLAFATPVVHTKDPPQPPQLFGSVCSLTHPPAQGVKLVLHAYVHAPDAHVPLAFAMPVVHVTAELQVPLAWQLSRPLPEQSV